MHYTLFFWGNIKLELGTISELCDYLTTDTDNRGHIITEIIPAYNEIALYLFIKAFNVSSKSSEQRTVCGTRLQGHVWQDHSRATKLIVLIIWEMWSPLVCTFSFGEETGDREIRGKTKGACKGSCCPLSISSVLISEAATAILSCCCLADTPQPIDGPRQAQHFLLF